MAIVGLKVPTHTGTELGSTVKADLVADMQAIETSNNDIEARQLIVDDAVNVLLSLPSSTDLVAVNAAAAALADRLLTHADVVLTGADVSLTHADVAASNAAVVAAESARDAAQLSAGVYADTIAGLAATTSGQYFSIPVANSNTSLILYLNSAGAAVEKVRYPSESFVLASNTSADNLAPGSRLDDPAYMSAIGGVYNTAPVVDVLDCPASTKAMNNNYPLGGSNFLNMDIGADTSPLLAGDYFKLGFWFKWTAGAVATAKQIQIRTVDNLGATIYYNSGVYMAPGDAWKWIEMAPILSDGSNHLSPKIWVVHSLNTVATSGFLTGVCIKKTDATGSGWHGYEPNREYERKAALFNSRFEAGRNIFPQPYFDGVAQTFITGTQWSIADTLETGFFPKKMVWSLDATSGDFSSFLFDLGLLTDYNDPSYPLQVFQNGDTLAFGFWMRMSAIPASMGSPSASYLNYRKTSDGVSGPYGTLNFDVTKATTWQFVQYKLTVANVALAVAFGLQWSFYTTRFGSVPINIEITGVTAKKFDGRGALLGYEDNEIYERSKYLSAEISAAVAPVTSGAIQPYLYGNNMQNFLSKLISNPKGDSIKIHFLTDSIGQSSSTDYITQTMNLMISNYGLSVANFTRQTYGGYTMSEFALLIEDAVVHEHVDLFYISEDTSDPVRYEELIKIIRARTTADIAIGTWSIKYDDLLQVLAGTMDIQTIQNPMGIHRALASKYNCELIECQWALVRASQDGAVPATLFQSTVAGQVHLNAVGATVLADEFQKHLHTPDWIERGSSANVLMDSERTIELDQAIVFPYQAHEAALTGAWAVSANNIASSVTGNSIIVDFNGIGFRLYYTQGAAAVHAVELSEDGGATWISSSAYRYMGLPLEYCTELSEKVVTPTAWIYNRFYKALVVDAPILGNGETEREYEITIDSIAQAGGVITANGYTVRDITNGVIVGTGDITVDSYLAHPATMGAGRILIPATYAAAANYFSNGGITVGDTYRFFVRSNWQDTLDTSTGVAGLNSIKVMGLARKAWKLRITKNDNVASLFDAVKIYQPKGA